MKTDELIPRFFKEDIGGILMTGGNGEILYEDEKTAFIRTEKTNWKSACPAPRDGQKGERWDLVRSGLAASVLKSSNHEYRRTDWTENKKYWPIPQGEIDKDPNLVQNNY